MALLTNLAPEIIFINDVFVNVGNLNQYEVNPDNLTIVLDYSSGDKDLLRFGTAAEFNKGVSKLVRAITQLDFGV